MLKNTLHNFALSLSECYVLLAIVLSRPRSVYAHLGNAYLYMGLWLLIGVAYSLYMLHTTACPPSLQVHVHVRVRALLIIASNCSWAIDVLPEYLTKVWSFVVRRRCRFATDLCSGTDFAQTGRFTFWFLLRHCACPSLSCPAMSCPAFSAPPSFHGINIGPIFSWWLIMLSLQQLRNVDVTARRLTVAAYYLTRTDALLKCWSPHAVCTPNTVDWSRHRLYEWRVHKVTRQNIH